MKITYRKNWAKALRRLEQAGPLYLFEIPPAGASMRGIVATMNELLRYGLVEASGSLAAPKYSLTEMGRRWLQEYPDGEVIPRYLLILGAIAAAIVAAIALAGWWAVQGGSW